jgi:hypothetical protein
VPGPVAAGQCHPGQQLARAGDSDAGRSVVPVLECLAGAAAVRVTEASPFRSLPVSRVPASCRGFRGRLASGPEPQLNLMSAVEVQVTVNNSLNEALGSLKLVAVGPGTVLNLNTEAWEPGFPSQIAGVRRPGVGPGHPG